jgi:predicted metal-binding protein
VITKHPMLGPLILCKDCCCGQTEQGPPAAPVERIKAIWQREKLNRSIQLTVSGCLGPCNRPNIVLLVASEGQQWLAGSPGTRPTMS